MFKEEAGKPETHEEGAQRGGTPDKSKDLPSDDSTEDEGQDEGQERSGHPDKSKQV